MAYIKGAKTGQQIATSRYGKSKTPSLREGPMIRDAERDTMPEENYIGAPARQISNTGKVRK